MPGMNYGTVDVTEEDGERYITLDCHPEVELMVSRLVPGCRHHPFRVFAHPENARIVRMIMGEYPMKVRDMKAWKRQLESISQVKELAAKLTSLEPVDTDHRFQGELFPFQKLGLDFLIKSGGNALVADEMGLGKTIQTLSYISKKPDSTPVVIIAPLVTLVNWKREIEKFLRIRVTDSFFSEDGQVPRVSMIRSGKQLLEPAEFYLVNYELLTKHVRKLRAMNPRMIVWDEIQNLRNTGTIKYDASKGLSRHGSVKYRIGLSGTPIYNRGIEMFNIIQMLRPGCWGTGRSSSGSTATHTTWGRHTVAAGGDWQTGSQSAS